MTCQELYNKLLLCQSELFLLQKKRDRSADETMLVGKKARYWLYLLDKLYRGRVHWYGYLFGYFQADFEPCTLPIAQFYWRDGHSRLVGSLFSLV